MLHNLPAVGCPYMLNSHNRSCPPCLPRPVIPPQEHDIASKQYLLLPLLTPSHGSLLVLCKPVERAIDDEIEAELLRDRQLPLILHLDSQCGA